MIHLTSSSQNANIIVCILFYEKVDQTIECIQSFLPSGITIIVCNNGSSAASRQKLIDFIGAYPQVRLIELGSNLGVSAGRNYIFHATVAEWLFFVDNDITIQTKNWLQILQKHLMMIPDAEVLIPQLYNVFERTYSPRYNLKIENNKVSFTHRTSSNEVNMFPGGASLVKRTIFDRLGLYDAQIFIEYEDYELCLRGVISRHPVKAYKIDDIILYHDHRRASGKFDRSYIAMRYDHNRARSSAERIFEKHHLRIQADSSSWSKAQKHKLLYGRIWWSKETLLLFIPAFIKKLWNNRK